jgi:hypothetical protein
MSHARIVLGMPDEKRRSAGGLCDSLRDKE